MTGFVDANILLRDCAGFRAFTSAQHCVKPARHCSKLSFAGSHQCTTGEGLTDTRRNRRAERACCPQALSSGWEAAVDSGTKGVRVFQMDHHPRKRIFAEVRVHASVEQVWRVITDYDHLADFVPNLIASKRLPITTPGRIHLQQLGCSQSVFWRLEAEAVLECVEIHKAMGAKELRFKAIEGDFKEYSGSWVVEPDPAAHTTTLLKYEISLEPKLSIPSAIVTCVVKAGLPANMMAMARRAEQVAEMKRKFPRFAASAIDDVELDSLPWQTAGAAPQEAVEQLPEAGPSRPICDAIGPSTQNQKMNSMGYLGMISVPLPHQRPEAAAESQEAALDTQAEATHAAAEPRWKLPSAPAPVGFWGRSPDLGVGWKCVSDASAVTEVHLRRLDEPDQLHRRVVAVLTVDATPEEVWKVLTDYERLPEVVPNLAVCERVQTPSGMSSRVTRLRQVGYKHMLYMSMHAEAVVDLVETKHKEVQFRQVQGDFSLLQGKFLLQEAESEKRFLDGRTVSRPQTHLKYAVEVQIPRDPLRLLGLVEPIIERMVYEDLPLNLGAIKQRVEEMKQRSKIVELEGQGEMQRAAALRRRLDSPPVAELQNDIASLVLELERCYGDLKRMPTRAELRGDNRGYLERAIAAHGGYGAVAGQIGWAMAYTPKRPRGYWNSITNVKSEVDDFIDANGLQPGIVPSLRDVRGADRCDLARAIEKWGGTDKGCCWSPGQAGTAAHQNEAWCFYSNDDISEYELVTTKDTDVGWEGLLRNLTSTQSELGPDITSLTVKADTSQSDILHITITDLHDERWHVPPSLFPESSFAAGYVSQKKPEAAAYDLSYASTPFSFAVTRAGVENDTAIFSTTGQRFMFKEQYIEVNSAIEANSSLFGLEEHTASGGLRLQRAGRPLAMWNHDTLSANADTNLYGSHPFVLEVRPDGSSHGILMLNSNAMEVGVTEDTLSWRMTGGVIDVHVLMGPTPSQVLQQLTAIIGRPALPPLWSLGFHQCKWGYKHVEELADVVAKYKAADIPLEVMWTDIDYMDGYRDFSLDPNNFSKDKMQAFVKQLHSSKQYWVPIVDPGIKVDPGYPAYDQGLAAKAFINDFTGKPYLGQVWPGATHFPDFLSKAGVKYWGEQLQAFHQLAAFDGLWIDMNEASNFCTGDVCHMPTQGATPNASAWLTTTSYTGSSNACQLTCDTPEDLAKLTPQQQLYRDPPYRINNANGQLLGHNTIGTTATHADGSLEYNAHNLYGLSEAVATHSALEKITGKRPFILTRSSFLGTGAVSAHWTGDNAATWADLRWSITTTLGMGLVGVPFVGADICGFSGDTTEELCARWISAGAFYPFARDHNTLGAAPQELYEWESVADAGRRAIKMRYQLLPHLYTAFHQANKQGTPVARPLWFAYPQDPATHAIDDQWLFGDVLVTPILDEGQTKREGYFPKGKWYNLFDNTTIDAHEGKSVTLDLPMGHVGVHMPGGTILPLQQAALVTADVRTSALTLLVALPHLEPLPALAATSETPSYNQQTGLRADSSMSQQSNAEEVSKQAQLTLPGTGRKLLTKSDSQAVMRQGRDVEGPSPGQKCGVSEAGRMTACGHIYMDDGHQLQVGQAGDNVADMYAEVVQDAVSGSWHGRLHVSFQQTDAGNNDCGSMSWPHIGSVVVKGVPLHARVMHVQAGPSSMTSVVATEQVMVDRQQDQLVVNGLQHEMQCGQAFAMTWTLTDNTALV